ncbi:beta-lactamase family protein [Paenibacillus rhizovicinus]|uniref:Beta-lactamase family protein n=1 Tax=Paenibacillus rhizovicinus TaxID=2704463 RepID=A0A6C0P016_9BACL|nr:serine hydrolase domain-containing protein [Paenibacillus rhizovicinus]QHW31799.1 beta-lactamase family protein [Paenibacillus rhizovicinus]
MTSRVPLSRTTPEEQGISSRAIIDFLDALRDQDLEIHSFMVLRRGKVAAEGWWDPYRPEYPHALYSLSKSFASTAIGFAVAEGLLSLDDRIVDFFPEDAPEPVSDHLSALKIRHLLVMGAGHSKVVSTWDSDTDNWVKLFLEAPIAYTPGTRFMYDSMNTYMLSAIIQRVTGQPLLAFLDERLFVPLGLSKTAWETCPRGIEGGGVGMSLTTEDIAKFGQLYLQGGEWEGTRLLPVDWIHEAAACHISTGDAETDNDFGQGYGYQFWRCQHGAYRGDGAFGQVCIVMPEQEAVIVMTSGLEDKRTLMNTVWDKLLPAMSPDALEPDEPGIAALAERIRAFRQDIPPNNQSASNESAMNGHVYRLEPNEHQIETWSIDFAEQDALLTLRHGFGEQSVRLGRGAWIKGRMRTTVWGLGGTEQPVEGSFSWSDAATLDIQLAFVETAFRFHIACHLRGQEIDIELRSNVAWDWEPNSVMMRGQME